MKIEINEAEENTVKVDIKIPKSEVDQVINEVATQFQPRVKVKGYREGKVPLNIVKMQFSREVLGEATTRLVYKGTGEALKDKKLRNVSNPVLTEEFRPTKEKQYVGKLHLDGSLSFSVTVDLPPDIDVTDYIGVEIEVDAKDFESWFKKQLKQQQMLYGEKKLVERPAKVGDELVVDFEGFLEGDKPMEGGKEEGYRLLIGEENFLKDFEDSFIGRSPGEKFEVDVKFPEHYPQEELAGEIVKFKCELHEVCEMVPHELNDDLAMMLAYESVDAMTEAYKEMWEQQFAEPMRAQIFGAIMDQLLAQHEFDVPQAWIDNETNNTIKRLSLQNLDQEPAIDSIKQMSERTVKIAYLLDKIYEKEEDIHLGVDEFKQIAEDEAKRQGIKDGATLIEKIKSSGQYEAFVTYHEQQKTLNFLIENAVIKEKE